MADAPHTVLVTDHDFPDLSIEREVLEGVAEVRALADEPDAPVDPAALADADGLLNLRSVVDAEAIAAMDDPKVIARYGIGVDNVDTDAATERGVFVTNVPDYCTEEVATHAVAMLLALARGLKPYDASVAAGEWEREAAAPLHRFSTRTVGVVGFGTIGRAVGDRAAVLGAEVLASDPYLSPGDVADPDATLVAFEDLLERADFVTVHSPLTDGTRGLFDADAFARMKPSASLVNVARGPIVDGDALLAALDAGEVRSAALDVFPEEPPGPDDPLRGHDRVLASPHVAWYSEEANASRRREAAENVRAALVGERPENAVNDVG